MTFNRSSLVVLALSLMACEPSLQEKEANLQEEVIALHDSAMARMGDLANQKKHLAQLQDSLAKTDTVASRAVLHTLASVTAADEAMWKWMRAYRPDNQKEGEKLPYLEQEKVKMQQVWQEMQLSLRAADSVGQIYSVVNQK